MQVLTLLTMLLETVGTSANVAQPCDESETLYKFERLGHNSYLTIYESNSAKDSMSSMSSMKVECGCDVCRTTLASWRE